MIGPEWAGSGGDERVPTRAKEGGGRTRVAVVTGTRAEFGLLRPVMEAVDRHEGLELMVVAAGSHLVPPALTFRDVKSAFEVVDSVPMQVAGRVGRLADSEALGRGIARFARSLGYLEPNWVVVLGDRIEAFAAASAASVGGIPVAHLHGGDIAEGVADDAMRHAITKLAHLHLPATEGAARRIRAMGEPDWRVVVVGSPAIDGLGRIEPLDDAAYEALGSPEALLLLHPIGRSDEHEEAVASACREAMEGRGLRFLWMLPNLDPGRAGVLRAAQAYEQGGGVTREHLPRDVFVGLVKRLAAGGGLIVGNSSSALIECQALRLPAVNVGSRQAGREGGSGMVHAGESAGAIGEAIGRALAVDRGSISHPFGDGRAGERSAAAIAEIGVGDARLIRKLSEFSDA